MATKVPSPRLPANTVPAGGPRPPVSSPSVVKPPPIPAKKTIFKTRAWDGSKSGEKIIIVAKSGMGKTTLASLAPKPVFIGLDDGGRKLRHPITGEHLQQITKEDGSPVSSYLEMRQALSQVPDMDCETVVIDTITVTENLSEQDVLCNVKAGDKVAANLESYGYGKGFHHLYDSMRLLLTDFDRIINTGKNVILIAQEAPVKIANTSGEDYLCDHPRLHHDKTWSVLSMYEEWADQGWRIAFESVVANKEHKATGSTTRIIITQPEVYYWAKSREINGVKLPPCISFTSQSDDSVWQFLFPKN